MKYFFYSKNEQQFGPFTLDEIKGKGIKRNTLVWTEGLKHWVIADEINELREVLISEPPPLPVDNKASHNAENIRIIKHYFYSEDDQYFGPFTLNEIKDKRIKKSTLVWTDGLSSWTIADKIDEFKEFLISEPPVLPKRKYLENKNIQTVNLSEQSLKTNEEFDYTYKKETAATTVGVLLLTASVFLYLYSKSYELNTANIQDILAFSVVLSLILRISITVWVVNIATRQNRNPSGWGFFAFILPVIALVIIGQMQKLKLKIEIDETHSAPQKIAILQSLANRLFLQNRSTETLEVLDKLSELKPETHKTVLMRAESLYQLEEYEKAKPYFTALAEAGQFLDKSNLYLGILEAKNYKFDEAINYWQLAKDNGSEGTQYFLDKYLNYKGKFLLSEIEIDKKMGKPIYGPNNQLRDQLDVKYLAGLIDADSIPDLDKYETDFILYQYGFCVKLSKLFKAKQFMISYSEILDITQPNEQLNFILFDKTVIRFRYIGEKWSSDKLEQICNDFIRETNIEPSINV